jgi:hypothetical protein
MFYPHQTVNLYLQLLYFFIYAINEFSGVNINN